MGRNDNGAVDDLASHRWERYLPPDPEYRRLHRGVRLDPESVWADLRTYLCSVASGSDLDAQDLIEDLMFWHAEPFVDRLATLAEECPSVRVLIAFAHVGGIDNAGVRRFDALQARLSRELEAEGLIERG